MKWLVETLDSNDTISKLNLLAEEEKKGTFRVFTPFWYELGSAYQKTGNIKKAKECYAEFERQKAKYSIIDNDSYYTELAKNMIQIAKDENDLKSIRKYLKVIENDDTVANIAENRFYFAGIYFSLKEYNTAQKYLKLMMSETNTNYKKFIFQARELYQYIDAVKTSDEDYKKIADVSNLKIATEEAVKKAVIYKKGKLSTVKNAMNFFFGSEEEKVIYYDKLAFILPENVGKYSLGIILDDKYYDSLDFPFEKQNEHYYFINYTLSKFIEKSPTFEVLLTDEFGEQITMTYDCAYFDSGDLKTLLKDKSYKDASDKKAEAIAKKYDNATIALFDNSPYKYKNHLLLKTKDFIFTYGVSKISAKNIEYEISKFGELKEPHKEEIQINESLKTTYEKALLGDAEAQYNLGMAYFNGENIEINYIEAVKWLKNISSIITTSGADIVLLQEFYTELPKNTETTADIKKLQDKLGNNWQYFCSNKYIDKNLSDTARKKIKFYKENSWLRTQNNIIF